MTVAKRYVPNKALKKKNGYCLGTKSPAANKRSRDTKNTGTKELSKFFFQRSKGRRKSKEEERLSRECSKKNTKRGTVPYL